MIRKFSPIVSKWHRNFGQSEIILSMDNGHSKNMEEEKLKKEKQKDTVENSKLFPFRSYAEGSWQQSSLYLKKKKKAIVTLN